ncbi:hypothetical protein DM860_017976 [Cuscuta australis]|uniref:Uncharacterized protein n=1 Tax=Cuscuta australis TaxID=267555 RepID=A0A328DXV5_9ASTE|nr:hypothetical protein DM860_017976 [Cuscuta australis]
MELTHRCPANPVVARTSRQSRGSHRSFLVCRSSPLVTPFAEAMDVDSSFSAAHLPGEEDQGGCHCRCPDCRRTGGHRRRISPETHCRC